MGLGRRRDAVTRECRGLISAFRSDVASSNPLHSLHPFAAGELRPQSRPSPLARPPSRMQRLATNLLLLPRWVPSAPEASKKLVFIRHAEGWHNKDYNDIPDYMARGLGETEAYWDARLTPLGEQQGRDLATRLEPEVAPQVRLVVVSPLSRAIQTAALAFPEASSRPPFLATSLCRERVWTHQCDRRRTRSELASDFPFVDFGQIADGSDEMWAHKEIDPSPMNSTAVSMRARSLLHWLWARPEKEIAVVAHWVFLRHLFGLFPEDSELGADFGNAEHRLATLVEAPAAAASKEEL